MALRRVVAFAALWEVALGCSDDAECELNGVCASGQCLCDDEWEGDSCGVLKLGDPEIAYGGPDYGVTSWGGGPPVRHPDGSWVLFVTEIADGCGLSEWATRSTIVRARSNRPEGPYRKDQLVIGRESHNAYYVYNHPTGEHLIYHVGMGNATGRLPVVFCSGGRTVEKNCDMGPCKDRANMTMNDMRNLTIMHHAAMAREKGKGRNAKLRSLEPLEPGYGDKYNWQQYNDPSSDHPCGPASPCGSGQPMIHRAPTLDGPWTPVDIPQVDFGEGEFVDGEWATGLDNPAPFVRADGSVVMLVKNYPAFTVWVAQAAAYNQPYKLNRNAGIFSPSRPGSFGGASDGDEEDPCMWQDHRGNYHAFFHNHRGHAFSRNGVEWQWGTSESWSGGVLGIPSTGYYGELYDTERPRVWVNPETRRAELLFFASGGAGQPTTVGQNAFGFTVVRKIGERSTRSLYAQQNMTDALRRSKTRRS